MHSHLRFALYLLVGLAAGCNGEVPKPAQQAAAATVSSKGVVSVDARIPSSPSFKITVTDADPNVDASSKDAVFVYVTSTTSTQYERVALVETDVDTGVFEGQVPIAPGTEVVGNGVIEVHDGETVTVTYRDQNDGTCSPAIVSATAVVDNRPDLTVASVTVDPATHNAGAPVTITASIHNLIGPAAGANKVKAEFCHTEWDYDGPFLSCTNVIGELDVPGLDSDVSDTVSWTYTLPMDINGSYLIKVCADAHNVVAERDETNNCVTAEIPVVGPDLSVQSITVDPAAQNAGAPITITASIQNAPGPGVDATKAKAQFCHTEWDYDGPFLSCTNVVGEVDVPAIGSGDATSLTWPPFTLPGGINGTYKILVCADSHNAVGEPDEINNCATGDFSVVGPDLVVASLSVTPTSATAGDVVTVTGSVQNAAIGAAVANTARATFGQMAWGDYGDPMYYQQQAIIGNASISGLGAGEVSPTFSLPYTIPTGIAGAHKIELCVDVANVNLEQNETNNCAMVDLNVY